MSTITRFVREPLLQFAVIGLALFAIDRATRPEPEDPRLIKVDEALYGELAGIFEMLRGGPPSAEDMEGLVRQHLRNEVLYREARALRLDEGDEMIRERLAQKMRTLIYGGVVIEEPDEETFKAWFEERRERYVQPAIASFRVIGVDGSKEEARAVAEGANERADAGGVVKPAGYHMVTFADRPRPQLVELFDEGFVAAIEAGPIDEWTAVETPRGWQAVEYRGGSPAHEPTFEEVRDAALGDWRQSETQRQAIAALEALQSRYPIDVQPYDAEALRRRAAAAAEARERASEGAEEAPTEGAVTQ